MLAKYLLIGEVVKPQGVNGEVKVKPYTDDLSRFQKLKKVYVEKKEGYEEMEMRLVRVHDGMAYLVLDNAATMAAAEAQRGTKLYVARENAVKLSKDENFICDLIGCEAFYENGERVGVLMDVLTDMPTNVYVFDTPRGRMMMPALKAAIPEVDVENKRMTLVEEKMAEVAVFED
jgi:16S rRNA processing protein RimM